jgi:hypothetical protein
LCHNWINPGEESLVHFAEIIRGKRQTVKILCGELAKSCQPSNLIKERGGYGRIRSSSSEDREPLDPHLVTRHPFDLTGVARGLNLLNPSEIPGSCQDIKVSGFGISKIPWTRDRVNP